MRYEVILQRKAKRDLDTACSWIHQRSPEGATRWYTGFIDALGTLETHPLRCSLAPENDDFHVEVRQLVYRPKSRRRFRALFTIAGNEVHVLHIRGAGQPPLARHERQGRR